MKNRCSMIRCPFQKNDTFKCFFVEDECEYYTPEIDYKKAFDIFCDVIADRVAKRLKEDSEDI